MKSRRVALVLAVPLLILTGAPAQAQLLGEVADVLLTCRARASHPNPSNAEITSTGSFSCGRRVAMEITVCLELLQIPVSCTSEGPTVESSLTVTTDPIQCIPGVYQTRTEGRVVAPMIMVHTVHSLPPVVVVQCV